MARHRFRRSPTRRSAGYRLCCAAVFEWHRAGIAQYPAEWWLLKADSFLTDASGERADNQSHLRLRRQALLEVVRAFKSDVIPSGVLRLGMSLDVYDQLYASSLKQLAILSLVLFVLGIVGSYAATSFKRLQVAEVSLEQLQFGHRRNRAISRSGRCRHRSPRHDYDLQSASRTALRQIRTGAIMNQPYPRVFADDLLFLARLESRPSKRIEAK